MSEESVKEQRDRESNDRIFKALRRLRRAGARQSLPVNGEVLRTWGSLSLGYPNEKSDARMHCVLKPFLYAPFSNVRERIARALARQGVVPLVVGDIAVPDVYKVSGSVSGFKKLQIFVQDHQLEEYLFLS
jgi:hypothetical protein